MLSITGPINNLSYGVVTKNIAEQLSDIATLFPINNRVDCDITSNLKKCLERANHGHKDYNPSTPCIRIWHASDMSAFYGRERIGWPIFELEEFTLNEYKHLKSLDKIIVCSEWAKQVVESYFKIPVVKVPLGVNTDIFKYKVKPNSDKVVFLNIGKWEVRKGHKRLADAFRNAFPTEDVELWMSCTNPFYDCSSWENEYRQKLGSRVKFIPFLETQKQLAEVIQMSDVGIFPSHAEGFMLPGLEMLACGKQLVTTNFTAQTEYCNSDNSILIESSGKIPARDGKWFHHGEWNDYNTDDLVDALRLSYKKAKERNINGESTGRRFAWFESARIIRRSICGISSFND